MKAAIQTEITDTRTDGRGMKLCNACWNGCHFVRKKNRAGKPTSQRISNCGRGECECPCVKLLEEEKQRKQEREERRLA
jgi:hypothetical protein